MGSGLWRVLRTKRQVSQLKGIHVVGLLFIDVQVGTVEIEEAVRQLVASERLDLHARLISQGK